MASDETVLYDNEGEGLLVSDKYVVTWDRLTPRLWVKANTSAPLAIAPMSPDRPLNPWEASATIVDAHLWPSALQVARDR